MNRTSTIRWTEDSYVAATALAEVNARSLGELVRWLVSHAHRNLPRTQELCAELIQVRIHLNILARGLAGCDPSRSSELKDLIVEIERLLRELR